MTNRFSCLSPNIFIMVKDAMNAIQIAEHQDFIRTFIDDKCGFMFSTDKRLGSIYQHICYDGHSGASMASTMRYCQYYLNHLDEWEQEQQSHIHSQ